MDPSRKFSPQICSHLQLGDSRLHAVPSLLCQQIYSRTARGVCTVLCRPVRFIVAVRPMLQVSSGLPRYGAAQYTDPRATIAITRGPCPKERQVQEDASQHSSIGCDGVFGMAMLLAVQSIVRIAHTHTHQNSTLYASCHQRRCHMVCTLPQVDCNELTM